MKKFDLVLRWNGDLRTLRRVDRLQGVPLHAHPRHLKFPHGKVAIVSPDNVVRRMLTASHIEGPVKVVLATGKLKDNGYIIRAKRGIVRPPSANEASQVAIHWHAVGQFRYFNARTGKAEFIAEPGRTPPEPPIDFLPHRGPIRRQFDRNIPERTKRRKENRLVQRYVTWMGDETRFEHHYLMTDRKFSDLFDRKRWRLFEASGSIDRQELRLRVAALIDYQRLYRRRPSLGLLLPRNPGTSAVAFMKLCGVTAIWTSPSGRFFDSSGGGKWSQRTFIRK